MKNSASNKDVLEKHWYYKIEYEKGKFTPGRPIGSLPIVRKFWQQLNLKNKRVLDIGAQEFVAEILLGKQSPAEIVAYDRLSLTEQFNFLSESYDLSKTKYVHGIPMLELKETLIKKKIDPVFDFVNYTGVLYHTVDPLAALAIGRSFLREGGLMFLETSVSTKEGYIADCNHEAALYPGSNYFQISPKILDYWCRMLRMEALDAVWYGGDEIKRIFIILRAKNEVVADPSDEWIRKRFIENDFKPYGLEYSELVSKKPPLPYKPLTGFKPLVKTDKSPNYVDVDATVRARGNVDSDRKQCQLKLSDEV